MISIKSVSLFHIVHENMQLITVPVSAHGW